MSQPRKLSSSVSMFIEDSRIAAVANANANPANPGQFYTMSVLSNSSVPSRASQENLHHLPPPIRPSTLDLFVPSGARTISYFEQNDQHLLHRKPREIIHKIIREDSKEEVGGVKEKRSNPPSFGTSSAETAGNQRNRKYRSQSVTVSLHPHGSWIHKETPNELNSHHYNANDSSVDRKKTAITSVNLTLRSPTKTQGGNPQCHYTCRTSFASPGVSTSYIHVPNQNTDLNSANNGNSSVTYSSVTNSPDGYESQLKIRIGPQGGSICATRRRGSGNPSRNPHGQCPQGTAKMNTNYAPCDFQEMKEKLLATQVERQSKLMEALRAEERKFATLLAEYHAVRLRCKPSHPEMERLKNQNQFLELECDLMTQQIDMLNDRGQFRVPLGETDENFYRQINPGQDVPRKSWNMGYESPTSPEEMGRWPTGSQRKPPPRPPPPKFLPLRQSPVAQDPLPWSCSMCTFQNHPDLNKCEQCEMSRFMPARGPM